MCANIPSEEFDYLVFDNGSCPEVKRELEKMHEKGWITNLILSEHNLGKTGALNQVLAGMPNEWICFADSDMLFRPGWLDACWKIQESFPNLGMIGAQIIFPDWEVDKGNTQFRQTTDPRFVFTQEKAPEWIAEEYCRARGATEERTQVYKEMLLDKVRNTQTGCRSLSGWQFTPAVSGARARCCSKFCRCPAGCSFRASKIPIRTAGSMN